MRATRSLHRAFKWISTSILVLSLMLWLMSHLFFFRYVGTRHTFALFSGDVVWAASVLIARGDPPTPPGLNVEWRVSGTLVWFPMWEARCYCVLPAWCLVSGFAPLAAPFRLRRARRFADHCCARCGYDLTGNVSGRCPECGTTRESSESGVPQIPSG